MRVAPRVCVLCAQLSAPVVDMEMESTTLLSLSDDELRHVLHAIEWWKREVAFLALVCTHLRDAVRRIQPDKKLHTSIASVFVSKARLQLCRAHWRSFGLGTFLGERGAPLPLYLALHPDRVPMEALWYYVKCAPANLIVNSWFNPSGFEHPSHQRCIDEDWLIHVPNRALLMFAAAHGRLDVLKKLERRRDGRSFMMLGAPALLDSPLFSCGVQARAFGTAVTHAAVAGAQEGSHFARMFAADTQAFLDLQHLFLRPAIRHGQMAVVNWVDKTLLDMGERYRRGFNEDRVTFCGVHIIGSWPHSNRWTCDRACVRALVADAACAGAVEPFAEAFDQIFALWHAGVEWAGAFFWSMMMWILTSGFGRGKLIKYIVRRCEIEAVAISQMLALPTIATTGLDLEHFVGTIPQGVPNRDMHLRDQAVQSMTFPGDAEYTEWLFYELCDRPDRGFLTSTARARRWSQKHTNWITNEETVVTCRHLAILAYERCPPCLRLSGAPHRKENLSAPFLGENGEHTEDPMAFAYVAALWERPSADAPSRLEGGAVVVAERWLRCELESDTGIRSCNQWRSLLHRLGMAGPPLLERVCKEYAHSTHARKLTTVGSLILCYCKSVTRHGLVHMEHGSTDTWNAIIRAHIRMGLRNELFSVEGVSRIIAGDDADGCPPYWATQPVQECLDEWTLLPV